MIAVIDYGMGNLKSVENALDHLGINAKVTSSYDDINSAKGLILPGVGAFRDAIKNLEESGLDKIIKDNVNKGKTLLGICLGMQLLFSSSEEGGLHKGLDLIPGKVVKFIVDLKVPHVGWNKIKINNGSDLLKDIEDKSYFYFVHSFYPVTDFDSNILASTSYGVDFASVVNKDNVYGAQFHPEKSGEIGLKLLKNFGELVI